MATDVLVLAEHRAGAIEPITHQLLRQGRELSGPAGKLTLLVLAAPDARIAERLLPAGADRVCLAEHEAFSSYNPEVYCRAVEAAVRDVSPHILLCGHTFVGMEVGPWVAARLDAALASNCVDLRAGAGFHAKRLVYGGAWQMGVSIPEVGLLVATMARGGVPSTAHREPAEVMRLDLSAAVASATTTVAEVRQPAVGEGDITQADVVVGVGRGIRDPAKLAMMEELAAALGGVLACSRPLVDLEWMPPERQVGASGREITSKVYLACGISGAAQHLAGIRGVETVIAINKDARAPIFGLSNYGVVGDLFEVVPALIAEALKRRAAAPRSV